MKFLIISCLIMVVHAKDILCPDGAYKCPSFGTCCENKDTSYGCCPHKNAACCPDFIHCCPQGTKCNVTNRSCDSTKTSLRTSFKWMVPHYDPDSVLIAFDDPEIFTTKLETSQLKDKVSDKEGDVCPDGDSCAEGNTCCPIGGDRYGCCRYRNAKCCADKAHCCPHGYECDIPHQQCRKNSNTNTTISLDDLPIFNINEDKFELPIKNIKKELCGPLNSCFKLGKVCCKYDNTVTCCPKGSSCLPQGKGCKMDVSEISGYFYLKSLTNVDVEKKLETIRNLEYETKMGTVCPDKTEACPTDNTCCMMLTGRYGCCPMPEATCCPDQETCCPHNYECVGNSGCERKPFLHLLNLPVFVQRRPYNNF